jgi:hypothetical protein
MKRKPSGLLVIGLLAAAGCAFGDHSIHLHRDAPVGEPQVFRGISIDLEEPEDLRPEPHAIVGAVRSGVGVKTADIWTDDDVRSWIRESMAQELGQAGFLIVPPGKSGFGLRVKTRIFELSCVETIGFGATMTLELGVAAEGTLLLQKRYLAHDYHFLITPTSGRHAADSLRECLRKILVQFVQDLDSALERSPE